MKQDRKEGNKKQARKEIAERDTNEQGKETE
jgi:hypothetical protein